MLAEAYQTKFFIGHDFAPTDNQCLSLWIGSNSMIYAISTSGFNEVFELGHLEFNSKSNQSLNQNISFFLHNFSLLKKKFEKVNICILNTDFTILPGSFDMELDLKSILSFSSGKKEIKNAFTHRVKDIRFCYTLDQELLAFIERSFSNAFIRHAGAVNLQLFFNHHALVNCDVFLNIGDEMIELMSKEQGKLVFYNVYRYDTNEDVLYYLLFAMDQFKLNPLTTRLAIGSQLPVNSELNKTIKKYIKYVSFVTPDITVKTHKDISKLPQHYYFTVLNQHVCEL